MARTPKVLKPEESYIFSKYFELPFDIEDILAKLGCFFERGELPLPVTSRALEVIVQAASHNRWQQHGIHTFGRTLERPRHHR